jgi:hypothetical protein
MPIRQDMKSRYPSYWRGLSWVIRNIRAQGRCEWCGAENGKPHPVTGSKVVLTVAHVADHDPANCSYLNLASLCQRDHLRHDRAHHAATRRRRITGTPDLFGDGA